MIIYCVTNKINNKKYIGQTTLSLSDRWSVYGDKSSNRIIEKAIRKYGKENFKIEQIEKVQALSQLNEREIFYIKEFDTLTPNGYNMVSGGNNRGTDSQETRIKKSLSHKGQKFSDGHKLKISRSMKGNSNSRGCSRSEEFKQNHSGMNNVAKRTEVREKIRLSKLGSKNPRWQKKI